MNRLYALAVGMVALIASTPALHAQVGAHYRDFQLGSNVASVIALTGVAASETKTVHERPAILQDLQWRRPYVGNETTDAIDPVRQIAFSFYNDQLYRLMIDYDRERTEGLTDADVVDAISATYGPIVKPSVKSTRPAATPIDEESGTRIAAWGNTRYSAVLYRSSYAAGLRLVVTSVPLSALARTAEAQAVRLNESEAPQRERARQKKASDDARVAQEKARLANKATFVP